MSHSNRTASNLTDPHVDAPVSIKQSSKCVRFSSLLSLSPTLLTVLCSPYCPLLSLLSSALLTVLCSPYCPLLFLLSPALLTVPCSPYCPLLSLLSPNVPYSPALSRTVPHCPVQSPTLTYSPLLSRTVPYSPVQSPVVKRTLSSIALLHPITNPKRRKLLPRTYLPLPLLSECTPVRNVASQVTYRKQKPLIKRSVV
ncbi:hypothetical protein GQ43DRAFT_101871 [Delitschia confertaspora ATCC 74209]|uniref:Uncharacterized protein n=1 Tax=Delitschia confertaspora ATCC 74209 TaxID=1513339 RepID=A0A9P4JT82_9PLEO|nr:hypothetical protein GQ43DRAFT_101871 [Delitschia confertaspora ATCC 74209]